MYHCNRICTNKHKRKSRWLGAGDLEGGVPEDHVEELVQAGAGAGEDAAAGVCGPEDDAGGRAGERAELEGRGRH